MTDCASGINTSERLVLPGVGAFADGMEGLRKRSLVEPLRKYAESGRPFLAICLGMQMLLETSYEFGMHEGLGIISGEVVGVPAVNAGGIRHKIPHIGWNRLKRAAGRNSWGHSPLSELQEGEAAYFVHSFMAVPRHTDNRLADCDYNGVTVCAAIASGAVTGCQFHPEKSGIVGLTILRKFLSH